MQHPAGAREGAGFFDRAQSLCANLASAGSAQNGAPAVLA
jgi:hypothetical protein